MTINSASDVIAVAKARGFRLFVDPGPPPMPYINGNRAEATPALMGALKAWRLEIIDILQNGAAQDTRHDQRPMEKPQAP